MNVKNDSKCTAMNVRNNGSRVSAQCQPESSRLYSSWSRCRPGAGQTAAGDTVTEVVVGPVRARQRQPTKIREVCGPDVVGFRRGGGGTAFSKCK